VETDDVADTINYADLAEIAHQVITGPPYNLIEKVAGTIANIIMARYEQLYAVEVTVHKPQAPIPRDFTDVAVVARRSRRRI
jgi:dihydroneopterin aldolase